LKKQASPDVLESKIATGKELSKLECKTAAKTKRNNKKKKTKKQKLN